ncbi:MAG: methylated-DNA--[Selenomonadales bacterium]|nr:methylated-DNA--[protein]-cysteine S-methyltransferase [Selenomonadales bacterium]
MTAEKIIASPVGSIYLAAQDGKLIAVRTHHLPNSCHRGDTRDERVLEKTEKQLEEYFAGKRYTFDLPLCMNGTAFQRDVWQATLAVPYGKTATYGDIARAVGNERSARAVGMAENKNPFHIIVPCHRIVGAGGKLTGYAGGLAIKSTLLALERNINAEENRP